MGGARESIYNDLNETAWVWWMVMRGGWDYGNQTVEPGGTATVDFPTGDPANPAKSFYQGMKHNVCSLCPGTDPSKEPSHYPSFCYGAPPGAKCIQTYIGKPGE